MPQAWFQTQTTTDDSNRTVPKHVHDQDGIDWRSGNVIADSGRYIVLVVADQMTLDTLRSTPTVTELTSDNAIAALRQTDAVDEGATVESFKPSTVSG